MNRGKTTSAHAITMGKLLLASLCDCALGNTEQFQRFFTQPMFDIKTGRIEVKTVRKRPDGKFELVTWDAQMVMRPGEVKRIDAPVGPVPTDA